MKNQIELLAPAGSIESFYAAVNSGADAVYLGGKNFNARSNSQNFNDEEMSNIIKYAHNKNVKVYVTMNIILKDEEITDALNYVIFLYQNQVDAVIVQDLGLFYLINKYLPDLDVNISTQAAIYDDNGVRFFERYNAKKVILARELSSGQINEIAKNTNTDLEVFIHGALCACYSGQCYMSSFLGGRSGNRGKCAQPCRLSYNFYDKERKKLDDELGVIPVLSMKDFKAGESIYELIDAGVKTFKIEGRMKGPEYTAKVVEYYRKIIDGYYKKEKYNINDLERKAVATFSRGYTNGYLKPDKDDEMFAKISSGVKGNEIDEIEEEIKDVICEFSDKKRKELSFDISLKIGQKVVLIGKCDKTIVKIESEELCETSIKNPVTEDIIKEQLSKLGNSIYKCSDIKIHIEEGVFVRKSTLNQLRRDITDKIYEIDAKKYNRDKIEYITYKDLFENNKIDSTRSNPKISLKINDESEISLIDPVKIKRVYIPLNFNIEEMKKIKDYKVEKYLWLPNIVSKIDYNMLRKNIKLYSDLFDGVCVNNYGTLNFFIEQNMDLKIQAGPFFNIINSYSAKLLENEMVKGFTFSIESNIADMESIINHTKLETQIIAHSYVQMMVMKNCPMSMIKKCKNQEDCNTCSYHNKYLLKDRKGMYFNIERKNKLTNIYNSVPLTLIQKTHDFVDLGINMFLIDTKFEKNVEEIIDAMYCELNGLDVESILKDKNFTRGHYFKNIL